ncbi:YPDG domain-containing protein [Corynebacterium jeikeium]|uniref:YPDG domain-containing protein n=1 Tax=Corynebacterium jeikeium TaxID=38289 RepID=UPI0039EC90A0
MKSIAAAGAVLALATTGTVVVQTQTAPAALAQQDESGNEGTTAGSDKAIYSPGKASQKGTISGSVKEIVEALVGFGDVQASGKPLKGVKVYAQWYEGENTQHSSPVYYTESDENGNFTINMAPYTDALGVTREFRADASVGTPNGGDWSRDENREKIRVWTELPEDMTDKYRLVHQPAAGIFPLTTTTPTTQGDGVWGGNKITGMTIQYAQKDKLPQHLPEENWAESTGTGGNGGTYAGQAFWNLDVLQGAKNHNQVSKFDPKDIPASGLKVVGSYLTDDAVKKIEAYAKSNFAGKTLRGKGWTVEDEQGLQRWINEQVAADPEAWIAETLTTTTGADGKFELRWKGIYGNSHKSKPLTMSDDKFGKLAGSHGEGSWLNGNANSKHVNMHWSYVSILGKDGKPLPDNIGALYPWALGQWAGPGFGAYLNAGANAQLFGGDGALIGNEIDGYTGWNIALAPQALKFDVVDKNTTDNWAALGDKVQTDTAGLPIADNLNYYIEWVDKDGKVVKTCETAKPDSATKIPSCELEVPADAQTGDTFTARLKVTPNNPDPKNDLVLVMDAFAVARDYLAYDPVDAKRGEEATSEPKFDNPATEPEEKKPEKAKFELGKLPEGVTEDQVAVDPATGVVTFTPNAEQAGKTFKFPVVMRDEALQVPVLDENGDPVPGQTQGRIVARADATFNVEADKQKTLVEPKYEDTVVVPGQDAKSTPSFVKEDEDGNPTEEKVDAPEGSKFTIGEDFKAPEGYTVTIDESTGVVTVTADPEKLNKDTVEEFEVPVTVEYPDGSKDDATAKFELDTDGDGKPDTEDEDDDGDGVPDTEEIEKGTNPKDKNERPLTPIDPAEPTTGATVEPKYEDTVVVPGQDAKSTPSFVKEDEDGNPTEEKVDAPEGSKFTIGEDFKAPEGYTVTIDESTGVVTVTADPEKLNKDTVEEFEVPVTVEYPDGSKDDATAKFELDTDGDGKPDTEDEDDDGDGVPDTEEIEKGTNPKDKNERPLTPIEPGNPTDAATFEPEYNNGTGQPGDDVTVPAPEFKDKDGKVTTPPERTTFTPGEGTPDGVTVDPNTGEITVTIPEDAKPGDKITVPVVVTYPDGSQDNVDVTVTVTEKDATPVTPVAPTENNPSAGASADDPASCELPPYVTVKKTEGVEYKVTVDGKELTPDADGKYFYEYGQTVKVEATPAKGYTFPEGAQSTWTYTTKQNEVCEAPDTKQADEFTPGYEDGSGKPGEDVQVPAPEFKDKDGNPTTAPDDTTFKPGDNAPDGVTVDPNTGEITVKVPEDATPGDKITVPVVVTYPDGSTDTVDVTVTVEQPDAPADQPDWKDDSGKPGDKVKIPNTGGDVPDGTTVETEGPGKAEIDENGNLVVDIDKDAEPGKKIVVIVKDKDGNEIDRVVVEVEKPDAPETEKPDWNDDKGKPGDKVKIPNTGGDVPDGTTVETEGPGKAEIDENGNLVVDIDKDAEPGKKVVVVVKDKDGNEIDRVVVEVEKPRGPLGSLDDPNKIGAIIGGTIVGSGLIGALLGNHDGPAGSSTPGKPGESKPGAEKPGKGNAGDQGANQGAGKGSTGAASQSTQAGSRGGSLAVTGVSGLAITLGASVIALALGGALMALRRRQS